MAEIDVRPLTAAARALMLAGRWAQAAGLLEDVTEAGPADQAVLAVAQAEVATDSDFWCRTDLGSAARHDSGRRAARPASSTAWRHVRPRFVPALLTRNGRRRPCSMPG